MHGPHVTAAHDGVRRVRHGHRYSPGRGGVGCAEGVVARSARRRSRTGARAGPADRPRARDARHRERALVPERRCGANPRRPPGSGPRCSPPTAPTATSADRRTGSGRRRRRNPPTRAPTCDCSSGRATRASRPTPPRAPRGARPRATSSSRARRCGSPPRRAARCGRSRSPRTCTSTATGSSTSTCGTPDDAFGREIASFDLGSVFRFSDDLYVARPLPWRLCARTRAGQPRVQGLADRPRSSPSGATPRTAARWRCPPTPRHAGPPGWFIGHLRPGMSATFTDLHEHPRVVPPTVPAAVATQDLAPTAG